MQYITRRRKEFLAAADKQNISICDFSTHSTIITIQIELWLNEKCKTRYKKCLFDGPGLQLRVYTFKRISPHLLTHLCPDYEFSTPRKFLLCLWNHPSQVSTFPLEIRKITTFTYVNTIQTRVWNQKSWHTQQDMKNQGINELRENREDKTFYHQQATKMTKAATLTPRTISLKAASGTVHRATRWLIKPQKRIVNRCSVVQLIQ